MNEYSRCSDNISHSRTLRLASFVVGLVWAVQGLGQSQAQLDTFFSKFQSNFIQILDARSEWLKEHNEDFPFFAAPLAWEWVGFNPAIGDPFDENCDLFKGRQVPKQKANNEFMNDLQRHVGRCAPKVARWWPDPVSHVLGTVFLRLNLTSHPWVRWVEVRLPGGVRLKGLLGLRGDLKKRPFVVFRTGIFASASNYVGEKFLFTQLFEQGLNNFLLLESTSSADFIAHNQKLTMGGFEEGLQNFYITRRLQAATEPLSHVIAGVHLVGMSMGGAGVLYANILDQLNGPSALQSAMLFCPLIDLKASINDKTKSSVSDFALNFWAKSRLKVVGTLWPTMFEGNFVHNLMEAIQVSFRAPFTQIPGLRMPMSAQVSASDPDYFWKVNDWVKDYRGVQVPTLIFATKADPAVPYELNSGKIANQSFNFSDSNLRLIPLDKGYHCTLNMAYNWKAQTQWLQSFMWQTNRLSQWGWVKKELPLQGFLGILPEGPIAAEFIVTGNDFTMKTKIKPERAGMLEKVKNTKSFEFKFTLRELDAFVIPDEPDSVAREVLRRWIYQNVQAEIIRGRLIVSWPVIY